MNQYLRDELSAVLAGDVDPRTALKIFLGFRSALERGEIRAAEPGPGNTWHVNEWVKAGILWGFQLGQTRPVESGIFSFFDKDTWPLQALSEANGIRLVPGGSAIRSGAYVAPTVVCMPPMYVNVGAYIDRGTLIDSHALVGSCAQIGKNVHLSAAAQIGGVIEPVGALPVIIEDNVFVGGNCGIYEGCLVRKNAVLAAGIILTQSSRVVDLVHERTISALLGNPLEIPEGAVVVSGSRPASGSYAAETNVSLYTPVIVKYRDEKTDASTALEEAIR